MQRNTWLKVATTFLLAIGLSGAGTPAQARFVAADPVQPDANTGENFNRYAYANNNPYRYTDPDGRLPIVAPLLFGAFVYLTSNYANAPGHGDLPKTMSPAEQVGAVLDALPVGRAGAAANAAHDAAKTYTTYTRTHSDGTVYSGRTSGSSSPGQQVARRTSGADHQAKTEAGYGPGVVDRNSANADAIRGREQQLIQQHGGAQSQGGTSANAINSVSPSNPNAARYEQACTSAFGC